jgi:hypothetical protein
MRQNPCLVFPSRQVLVNDILLMVVERTKGRFILSTFKSCHSCTISFDLWISKVRVDTFVMIMYFLNDKWEFCHIIVGFFETINTSRNAMAL